MSNGSEWHKLDLLSQRAVGEGEKKDTRFHKDMQKGPVWADVGDHRP